jgi:hypothetical protein
VNKRAKENPVPTETGFYVLDLFNDMLFARFAHEEHNKSVVTCVATDKAIDVAKLDGRH